MNVLSVLNECTDKSKNLIFNNKFISFSRNCTLKHWNSYFDKKNNIEIKILGRPVLDSSEWKEIERIENYDITYNCEVSYVVYEKIINHKS